MATVTPTVSVPTIDGDSDGSVKLIKWTPLANGDDGSPVSFPTFSERSIQLSGTFGSGGSVSVMGSNDGTTWAALGSAITSAGIRQVAETTLYLKPSVTAGDGTTSITVSLLIRRRNPMRT